MGYFHESINSANHMSHYWIISFYILNGVPIFVRSISKYCKLWNTSCSLMQNVINRRYFQPDDLQEDPVSGNFKSTWRNRSIKYVSYTTFCKPEVCKSTLIIWVFNWESFILKWATSLHCINIHSRRTSLHCINENCGFYRSYLIYILKQGLQASLAWLL